MSVNLADLPKVNAENVRNTLTFDEMDQIEALTGMSLTALEHKAQSRLIRGLLIVGLARAGHVVSWDDLAEAHPDDMFAEEDGEGDVIEEDPT